MATLGNLVADLSLDWRKFRQGLEQSRSQLDKFAGDMTSKLKTAAAGLAAAFAVGEAIGAAQESIDAQKKLEAVLRATGNAAGFTADQIMELASARQALTNFDDDETINASAILATFKQIRGDVFERTIVAMQDLAVVMESDLKGAAVMLGKALNDPVLGMTALNRSGITFTEAQRKQVQELQAAGKLVEAQLVVLRELEGQVGGASEGMADPITQIKNLFGGLVEEVGKGLIWLAGLLIKTFDLKTVIDQIGGVISLVRLLIDPLVPALQAVARSLAVVAAGWLAVKLVMLAYAGATKVAGFWTAILTAAADPKRFLQFIGAVLIAVGVFAKLNEEMQKSAEGLAGGNVPVVAVPDVPGLDTPAAASPLTDAEKLRAAAKAVEALHVAWELAGAGAKAFGFDAENAFGPLRELQSSMFNKLADDLAMPKDAATNTREQTAALRELLDQLGNFYGPATERLREAARAQIAALSGVTGQVQNARDEIARLGTNEVGLAVGQAADLGALPGQLAELRTVLEELRTARADEQLGGALAQMQGELDVLQGKLTEAELKLREFAEAGASAEQLERFRQLTAYLKEARRLAEMKEQGKQLAEQLRTPAEELRDRLAELDRLREANAVDDETLRRGRQDAADKFLAAQKKGAEGGVSPALKGTREAFQRIFAAQRGDGQQKTLQQVVAVAKQQLAEQKKQTDQLANLGNPDLERFDF